MRTKVLLGSLGMVMTVAATALAQDANPAAYPPAEYAAPAPTAASEVPGRFFLGARLGYGLPMGALLKDDNGQRVNMSEGISGQLPIWLDIGYMVTPNVLVGGYLKYGYGLVKDCPAGSSCSINNWNVGAQAQFHLAPTDDINPWLGLGIGYEVLSISESRSGQENSSSLTGYEYLVLQGGLDFKAARGIGIGPFMSFSLAQYTDMGTEVSGRSISIEIPSEQTAMHEWLLLGIRGAFKL